MKVKTYTVKQEISKDIRDLSLQIKGYQLLLKDPIQMSNNGFTSSEINQEINDLKTERFKLLDLIN